jgi:hypothetical protein
VRAVGDTAADTNWRSGCTYTRSACPFLTEHLALRQIDVGPCERRRVPLPLVVVEGLEGIVQSTLGRLHAEQGVRKFERGDNSSVAVVV